MLRKCPMHFSTIDTDKSQHFYSTADDCPANVLCKSDTIPSPLPGSELTTVQPLVPSSSIMFVSKAGLENGSVKSYNLKKHVEVVKNTRTITKLDMKFNNATPEMKVDPETFVSYHPLHDEVPC